MDAKILQTLEYGKILSSLSYHTQTPMGKQAALQLRPSAEAVHIQALLTGTDEAFAVDRLKGTPSFTGVVDISTAVKRARIGGTLNPQELLGIRTTIQTGRRINTYIEGVHEQHEIKSLLFISEQLSEQKPLEQAIKICIDDNAEVLDTASPELAQIRRELRSGVVRIREKLDSMIRSSTISKMLQDQIITIRGERFVIPVKAEYRSYFGGIVHDQSGSGATLFIEPESIVTMNNKLREMQMKEEREIEVILQKLTAQVGEQAELLLYDLELLGSLDFIFAKGRLAREMKASLPIINDHGYIKMKKGRHPLISFDQVVPIDIELGGSYSSIIVTGPNTGGKTVTLKTLGLLSLMAMSGLFVPAEDGSELSVFDAIYADIGDEQSIEQNLSTFSSHMTNIVSILRQMTRKSLVLLDEVGAGTDPAEGSALAVAILEHIHATGCRMVATTHYSELKAYAYERDGIINASMEFDVATLSPTYRLLVGVPGRSNAFAIAERLGLSTNILDYARGEVAEEDQRVEHMIASLEENRLTAEQERLEAEKLRKETEQLRGRYQEELDQLERQRERMLEKAEEEARQVVQKARSESERIITELRQLAREEGAAVKEHRLIAARKGLEEAEPERRPKSSGRRQFTKTRAIEPGDEVQVHSLRQKGHVVELAGSKEAIVQLGIMKMKVSLDDLELLDVAPKAAQPKQRAVVGVNRTRDDRIRSELDLRGANVEEALMEVDRFMDEAFMANLGQVYIIHGKGTGVLRSGIQDYLRRHKHVKSYRLGNYGEGGAGVTVAELK